MIDQIKIGGFLKELRKEKGVTQEQLAEMFHISSRSVSRWENGNTMPDLGMLVELADYYDVDIREIIDGKRKSESEDNEINGTIRKVADYADAEKRTALKRRSIIVFVGTLALVLGGVIGYAALPEFPENSILKSDGLWLGLGITGLAFSWGTVFYKSRKNK